MSSGPFSALTAFLSRNRFFIALMAAATCEQSVITMARVASSYRAIEFEVSVVIIGIITAAYSLAPIFLGVAVGRYVDLGHDVRVSRIGSALMALACLGLALSTHWIGLLIFNVMVGIAHMCLYIGLQVMCTRDDRPGAMERTFGNFMVANAVGQALGSSLVGYLGGSAALPPAQLLFSIAGGMACLSFIACSLIPPARKTPAEKKAGAAQQVSLLSVLKVPGFLELWLVSAVAVLAQDLLVVYLPLLGVARGISVDNVGTMLALRAGASMLARIAFSRLYELLGGNALLALATLIGAGSFLVLVFPIPLGLMYAVVIVSGFMLGIAITVSIAASMVVTPAATRGTATSLRMVGNRVAQFAVPFLLSLVAAATGPGSIFAVLGAGLFASAAATHWKRPAPR